MKVHPDRVKAKVKHVATAGWCASSRAVCGIALRGKDVCFEMVRPFGLGDYDMDGQGVSRNPSPAILAEEPRDNAVNPARA